MGQDEKKDQNVVDLAAARKRQRTVSHKTSGRVQGASAKGGKGGKGGKGAGGGGLSRKAVGALQLVLFLGVLFYFTQLCHHGG